MKATSHRTAAVAAIAAIAAALAVAAPAGAAKTVELSGTQTVVDENAGLFKMHGSLVGDWAITSYDQRATSPLLRARGTERFSGCLDRGRDGGCSGDPTGTLKFTFNYWALFGSADPASLVWGACFHPITGGTGGFAGARGVITMVDTPTSSGVRTAYIGNLTLGGAKGSKRGRARAAAIAPRGCEAGR